jgi:hypothetical protein
MKERLSFAWFWIRYQLNSLVSNFSNKKMYRYLVIITGRYPSNLNTVLRGAAQQGTDVRYALTPNNIHLMVYSKKKMKEFDDHMKNGLEGFADAFTVIQMGKFSKKFYSMNMSMTMYRNLFGRLTQEEKAMTLFEQLDTMQTVMNIVQRSRERLANFLDRLSRDVPPMPIDENYNEDDYEDDHYYDSPGEEAPAPENTEAELNRILIKIKEGGLESLTEEEKLKLQKYGNNL